jgi:hypothetical protein
MGLYEEKTYLLRERLIKEYGRYVPEEILRQYRLHEKAIIVNDFDPDLYPIPIQLPNPPPYHTIDGFGLPADEQYFRPPTFWHPAEAKYVNMPVKLYDLVNKILGSKASINSIWEALDRNRTYYASEIYWIKLQWYYRKHGYWFFNNGIPTYIDGWNWMYLSWWHLDVGLPQYRYRDRIFFLFAKYCYTTTEAPYFYRVFSDDDYEYFYSKEEAEKVIQQRGLLCQVEKGNYIVDLGVRTVFGFNYPKHRREGATRKAGMINYEIISSKKSAHGGIQSKDEKSAENDVYKDVILNPFKKLPFFFRPIHQNSFADGLIFDSANLIARNGGFASVDSGLESKITFKSAGERQYDGTKLMFSHGDETGKYGEKPYNIILRWNVIMKTLAQGTQIHGLAIHTSTVSDTSGDAGRNFMHLCKSSKWEKRSSKSGRTESGLLNLFTPATINYDGFSDRYGNPVIKKPTIEQKKYIGVKFGAEEYLENQLQEKAADPISYYETMREFPTRFRHCFYSAGKESGFNLRILSERMAELDMHDELKPRTGNFMWVDRFGGDVKFVDDPDGKFYLSYIPATPNHYIITDGKKKPANTHQFVASADPFKFENIKGGKKSDGGGCVFLKRDPLIDPSDKDTAKWLTNRTVCTYRNRVELKETYKEDMLMMCVFFGTKIFPENNVNDIYEYFKATGFDEYLQYIVRNGVRDPNPGFFSGLAQKQKMFSLVMDYVETHGFAERHRELLQEINDITGLDDMTNFDLFTAFGGCLLAIYYEDLSKPTKPLEEGDVDPIVKYLLGQGE